MSTLPQLGEIGVIPIAIIQPPCHFEDHWQESRLRIYRVCLKFVCEPDLAEDLTSEAFLRAWRYRDGFRGTCKFSTWIHRIAVNVCLEHIRNRKVKPDHASLDEMQAQMTAGESGVYEEAIKAHDQCLNGYASRKTLLDAIGKLPMMLRTPIILSEIDGYTDREIAAILDTGINSVKSRIHRGRNELRYTLTRRR